MVVGIGSGSTIVYAVEYLAELVRRKGWNRILCVPSSFQASMLIGHHQLNESNLMRTPVIDVALDGADELDAHLNLIKGGGGALTPEKIVISNAKKFVCIVDESKKSRHLGQSWKKGVPVEVIPMAHFPLLSKLSALGGTPVLRQAVAKAGPVVTDSGHFIIDVNFDWPKLSTTAALEALHMSIKQLPGVVESGFFLGMTDVVYVGGTDGAVSKLYRSSR
eukprot:TRINITY_DN9711_c0_g1_i1.p1 TRINITY_DN9711_c0_g1~~TRINITY_DN9711_c0_g1_i1.p1  ORF type:complete len:251 (-),score=47.86 TRINITY_DN9711_c0_g1_i1:45-704(-)